MKKYREYSKKYFFKPLFFFVFSFIFLILFINLITTPSNERNWNDDQKILPFSEISDNYVTIHNIRNFTYSSTKEYTKNYYDKTFDLNTIKKVWYIVEPFPGIKGSAHTFLSFEFENNTFISISIEIRKEKNESFNPIKGIFNYYELMYVIADEKDVISLRADHRKDPVYLYPTHGTKEGFKTLFLDMITRANILKDKPEFYNSITNNCTTNIVKHVNKVSPKSIPYFTLQSIFPEYSNTLAYKLNLLDVSEPLKEKDARYLINEKVGRWKDGENFSLKIREEF